jgi:CRP/FNR family transcriptional regulator, cyclic AMP receptor protein
LPEAPEIALEQAEFFRALPPERLQSSLSLVRERRFARGRVLFFEGRPAECLWVVHRGEVRLYKGSADGRVTTLEILRPGEMFGAVSALDREEYTSSAEAVTDGTAWCLPRRMMLKLVSEVPVTAIEILVVTSRRLRDAHERLRSFAHDPAPARLAQVLLRRAEEGEARVTRRALAEAAGTTVETAIRVLRRFEREGIVDGSVGRVRVVDEPALRKIAEGPIIS